MHLHFYRRHSELINKYDVGFKALMQQIYGGPPYKDKTIARISKFSDEINKISLIVRRWIVTETH